MNKIEIDGNLFGYHILPDDNYVIAKIYYKKPNCYWEYYVSVKRFGSWYRQPNENDYNLARMWCEKNIELIKKANK